MVDTVSIATTTPLLAWRGFIMENSRWLTFLKMTSFPFSCQRASRRKLEGGIQRRLLEKARGSSLTKQQQFLIEYLLAEKKNGKKMNIHWDIILAVFRWVFLPLPNLEAWMASIYWEHVTFADLTNKGVFRSLPQPAFPRRWGSLDGNGNSYL